MYPWNPDGHVGEWIFDDYSIAFDDRFDLGTKAVVKAGYAYLYLLSVDIHHDPKHG